MKRSIFMVILCAILAIGVEAQPQYLAFGGVYHVPNCPVIGKSGTPVTAAQVASRKLTPCQVCHPERPDAAAVIQAIQDAAAREAEANAGLVVFVGVYHLTTCPVGGKSGMPVRADEVEPNHLIACSTCRPEKSVLMTPDAIAEARKHSADQPAYKVRLAAWNAAASAPKQSHVNMAGYLKIDDGMTYDQVVAILGAEGTELTRSDVASYHTIMYQWKGDGYSSLSAIFQNDRLVQKSQFGLK